MSATVGSRKTAATTRSPRRPENRLATARSTPTIATNKPTASIIVRNLCVDVTRAPFRRSGERARRAVCAPDPSRRTASGLYFGQDASILSTVSFVLWPVIHLVACFQKELAPTAAG